MNILLVDDEQIIHRSMGRFLQRFGHSLRSAGNGVEALEEIEEKLPDLVITDIRMPAMDGIELLDRLRTRAPSTPVVVITGHGDVDTAVSVLNKGAYSYLCKPIKLGELSALLERIEAQQRLEVSLLGPGVRSAQDGDPAADLSARLQQLKEVWQHLEPWLQNSAGELPLPAGEARELIDCCLADASRLVGASNLLGDLIQKRSDLEQRLVEQDRQLSRTERYLYHLLDAAPFAILSTDMQGRIITCNSTAQSIYGYADFEIVGQDVGELFGDQALTESSQEAIHGRKDGTSFPALVHRREIVDDSGQPIALLYVVEDHSERTALESQLLYAQRLATLGELAPRIAHEFKTPLQVISGYLEFALDRLDHGAVEEARTCLQNTDPATRELLQLVQQISNLGRPAETRQIALDLSREMDMILEHMEPLGVLRHCRIIRHFAPDLPSILGDPVQIEQLFRNLVVNAAQAMEGQPEKNLVIHLQASADQRRVEARIRDSGPGIPEDHLARIFQPFFTTKPEGKGTGLGLSIVRTIVQRHGGEIDVDSRPGKGTCFRLSFPAISPRN